MLNYKADSICYDILNPTFKKEVACSLLTEQKNNRMV